MDHILSTAELARLDGKKRRDQNFNANVGIRNPLLAGVRRISHDIGDDSPPSRGKAMTNEKDSIYATRMNEIEEFRFDENVAGVFSDMIQRSVPGYSTILAMIGEIASRFVAPHSRVYDLGCSLGASSLAVRARAPHDCVIEAVDNSSAMVDRFRQFLQDAGDGCTVNITNDDIRNIAIIDASLVILNFTLQFISIDERLSLLRSIANGTRRGGALVLSEKIRFEKDEHDELMIELHHAFKRANGYSALEISQKRTALENRLIPETLQTHIERLKSVGYSEVVPWFQTFNFVSILAVR